jgi:hypothetical protein
MESARVIIRRLIWNLNDESGGIGWGSPEAMGEIMAGHDRLAEEYHNILISYIMPDGNYIEHELVEGFAHLLYPYMESPDPTLRGLAAWTARLFDCKTTRILLKRLENDQATLTIYLDGKLEEFTVAQLALIRKTDQLPPLFTN